MKYFSINSIWLKEFNTWSAEFFTLLEKKEYEEILKLSSDEIKDKIISIGLLNKDVESINKFMFVKFKRWAFNLNLFTTHIDRYKNKDKITLKSSESINRFLDKKANIRHGENWENSQLKQQYVYLIYALREMQKDIKEELINLNNKADHLKDLSLKIESKGGINKNERTNRRN